LVLKINSFGFSHTHLAYNLHLLSPLLGQLLAIGLATGSLANFAGGVLIFTFQAF